MLVVYIIILCLSAALVAFGSVRVARRVAHMVAGEYRFDAGFFAAISALAFLMVMAAPSKILVAAFILVISPMLLHRVATRIHQRWSIPLLAVLAGGISLAAGAHLAGPQLIWLPAIVIGWAIVTLTGPLLSDGIRPGSISLAIVFIPLIGAALFLNAPHSIAYDAGLILCALFGLWRGAGPTDRLGAARLPLAYLAGWLMAQTALSGAWPVALISLLAWGGAIAYATLQPPGSRPHAFHV